MSWIDPDSHRRARREAGIGCVVRLVGGQFGLPNSHRVAHEFSQEFTLRDAAVHPHESGVAGGIARGEVNGVRADGDLGGPWPRRGCCESNRAEDVRAKLHCPVGLRELAARRPSQISGGQQQRIALARTIAIEPKVLLLDEPLSNLDAKLRIHMRTELLALQRKLGVTTIFVTHDQEEALSIADRVAVLDQGVIQQVGTPVELFDTPANRFIATFVGTINLLRGTLVQAGGRLVFRSEAFGEIAVDGGAAGPAEFAIRPHALQLAAPGGPMDGGRIWVDGTVTEREFLGEFVRYKVKVKATDLVVDQPHYMKEAGFAPGAAVRVGINPAQARLLSA